MHAVESREKLFQTGSRPMLALFFLGLFLLLKLFAASETLHSNLHQHSETAGHQCVLTLIAQGHVDVPAFVSILVSVVFGFLLLAAVHRASGFYSLDQALVPVRGPPCR